METSTGTAVFDRVVCGVDRSAEGVIAACAAGIVTACDGTLTLVSANDPTIAVHAGWSMGHVLEELAAEAQVALERARGEAEPLHPVRTKLVEGPPVQALEAVIEQEQATLVVVGSHGGSRAAGIVLGAISTHVLHEAPCSILVARGAVEAGRWPRRIVVGLDGSPDSARAFAAAAALAARFGSRLRAIVAVDDARVDVDAAKAVAPDCEEVEGRALDALQVASETADLVVVGSRGLHGLRALGSLSERLAHQARCSVLVVRHS